MSSPNSLYNLSLHQIFSSFNKELFKYMLQCYPNKFIFEILFKMLNIHLDTSEFDERVSEKMGKTIIRAPFMQHYHTNTFEIDKRVRFYLDRHSKNIERLYYPRAYCDYDEINVREIFDLDFLFKFVDSEFKIKLLAVFKACVQITSRRFPHKLAEQWLEKERMENNADEVEQFIDQGLKLGIFFYDAGWFIESAVILSRTHRIIVEKWFSSDLSMLRTKTAECLTILLLALSNCYNFIEAHKASTYVIDLIESIKETEHSICLAHTYLAISHYYYIIMEYKKALPWAAKAILGLHDTSSDDLKFLVISHAIRICSVTSRTVLGVLLINKLNSCDKTIFQNVNLNFLLNKAFFYWTSYNKINYTFYIPMELTLRTYGYFNLKTASAFIDYACAIYFSKYMNEKFDEGLSSILQALFIMRRIGLPKTHMLVLNAKRVKGLLYEGFSYYFFIEKYSLHDNHAMKLKHMLGKAYTIQVKTFNSFRRINGCNDTLYTAESYVYLGRICQYLSKYRKSQLMHLQAVEIKTRILGSDATEVAWSWYFLANLYMCPSEKYWHLKSQKLFMKLIKIYERDSSDEMYELQSCYQRVLHVHKKLNQTIKCAEYLEKLWVLAIQIRNHFIVLDNKHVDENSSLKTIDLEPIQTMIKECIAANVL